MKIVNCKLKIQLLAMFSFILVFISVLPAYAAELNFSSPYLVGDGDHLYATNLNLDTQGDNINALEAYLKYSSSEIKIIKILTGDSLVNFWLTTPTLKDSNIIHFSGIVPAGYTGNGKVLTLVYQPLILAGQIHFDLLNDKDHLSHVFLNNAQTTEQVFAKQTYQLLKPVSNNQTTAVVDTTPPDPFDIIITKNNPVSVTDWLVTFDARDNLSGIDYYEMTAAPLESQLYTDQNNWQRVTSPALFKPLVTDKFLAVKAVDKSGNSQMVVVNLYPPENQAKAKPINLFYAIIILASIAIATFLLKKIKKNRHEERL